MNTPFASFCISTFKRPEILKATLESIKMQTMGDFEVIVSDNDVLQSARKVVEGFEDNRFRYLSNESNLGMKKSFNRSLMNTSGKFVVMMADDDPIYPYMLSMLQNLEVSYPGYGMYMGGCDWYCTDPEVALLYSMKVGTNSCLDSKLPVDAVRLYSAEKFVEGLLGFSIFPHYLWSTCIVKREILIDNGGTPDYGTPFLGDYAYLSMVAACAGCVTINRSLGCQTLHKENFGRYQHEQLALVAKNFPDFLLPKLKHLENFDRVSELLYRFTALWLVQHMSFLYKYFRGDPENLKGLKNASVAIFSMKEYSSYHKKYILKSRFTLLHDLIVNLKLKIRK